MNPNLQRILLVDDDHVYLQRLARALRDRGCTVAAVETAEAAMAAARLLLPQAAVLDLKLPGASGLACLRELHAAWPEMRILILTGYGSIATAMEAVRQGVWDYLTKPVDADQILAALTSDPSERQHDGEITPSSLDRLEWEHIQRVLNDHQGNVTQTAAALGMHRRSLQRKLRKEPPNP
ncbi:MAG: response regulator [Prosthecobacter sp.]|jgi:two-component system response regulator RegA|uniref:response regulator transcription factor n=1 Tax=Prosthecobacter sp. TaxID=1965333 RepID=UPI001A03969D|nr:response regulator [Prosthecobacter sp.]MBE2286212.1 response regulator [Prosthecobacter sp.]